MIVVTGHVRFRPEKMEEVRPHMRTMLSHTRREDGCLLYAYGEDVIDPGLVRIVERWRDWATLSAHIAMPHLIAWRAALKTIGVLDREVIAHETGEERAL